MSKAGKPFATMNVAVTTGADDDGKPVSQWVRLACFGQVAEDIAARAGKQDRVYFEGSLTASIWQPRYPVLTAEDQIDVPQCMSPYSTETAADDGSRTALH